jgi:hypothetical protein
MSVMLARTRIQGVIVGTTRDPLRDLQQAARELERADREFGQALGLERGFADLGAAREHIAEYGTGRRGGLAAALVHIDRFVKRVAALQKQG